MGITIMTGLLGVHTTGFWGSISDRLGRLSVMAICKFGLLLSGAAFLFIVTHPTVLTSLGAWTLFVGPLLQGVCGGLGACITAIMAYVADGAGEGSAATFFALIVHPGGSHRWAHVGNACYRTHG
jgi:MFS family permease